ncbi:MAG: pyruvate formate-lyase [Kiritimatiellaeota bacterium]|nr:pyruvate formate-lyase [Kiritimatiellota bacterium]
MRKELREMRHRVRAKGHAVYRRASAPDVLSECEAEGLSWPRRVARLLRRQCEAETPVILPGERIVFTRTVPSVPPIYSEKEWDALFAAGKRHELGPISNICADWGQLLHQGLLERRAVAEATRAERADDPAAREFVECAMDGVDAVLELAARYEAEARRMGETETADVLARVPARPARTFREALQALRFVQAMVWLNGHYHVGLGRFDQYMGPFLEADLRTGRLTVAEAEDLLAEFFISLNKDTDLYPGVQQGDNGQSLMLGGVERDGADAVNELTYMALRVARDVNMIDPKINLRVTPQTPLDLLELAAQLTRQGLGFPQYSNDDVVIPALVDCGYDLEDARDYTVAACWEFIIPGKGMEIVNIGAVSFPAAVNEAILDGLAHSADLEGILERTRKNIRAQVDAQVDRCRNIILPPAPFYSVLMNDCLEQGRDLSTGLKYNNYGLHGACSANAADALAAVKHFVFDRGELEPSELVDALITNYDGREDMRRRLAREGPKVGNNDDRADAFLVKLFDFLADACEQCRDNGRGGILRPGTGSAMYYVWLARGSEGMAEPVVGATADGRKRGDFFSSSLAPSPGAPVRGPISVLQTYGKIDYRRICNGGPITMELSDTVFRDPESIRKVAMLVRTFAELGCQQFQLNALNADTLLDAREHPERHRDLIVRVWGWSGYFCELGPEYQEHIIARHMHGLT